MHIILHALFSYVVVQCVVVMNINYADNYQHSKLRDRSKAQHSTLSKTEQLLSAKMSGSELNTGE